MNAALSRGGALPTREPPSAPGRSCLDVSMSPDAPDDESASHALDRVRC